MYTEEDLEEIREKKRGEEDTGKPKGEVDKSHFTVSLLISTFATIFLIYLSLSSIMMVSVAVSVGGTGGFFLEFEEIKQETLVGESPDEFFIYPVAAETSECKSTIDTASGRPNPGDSERAIPLLKAQIEEASVTSNTSLEFMKGVDTPDIIGIENFVIKVNNNITDTNGDVIGYGDVDIGNTSIIISELRAERLQLANASIDERKSNNSVTASDSGFAEESPFGPSKGFVKDPNPSRLGELVVSGQEVTITKGSGVAHFVSFESLDITSINLEIDYNVSNAPVSTNSCPV